MDRKEELQDDKYLAFRITSAKPRTITNQIAPNLVKRRIDEFNELLHRSKEARKPRSSSLPARPVPIDNEYRENLKRFVEDNEIEFDTRSSDSYCSSSSSGSMLEDNRKGSAMLCERRARCSRKEMPKRPQSESEHLQLVKYYRKFFGKLTKIPFICAVVYCSVFFVSRMILITQNLMYPSS